MYSVVDDTSPTSNAPLKGGKASIFEGGVRVPMIVAWPNHIKPNTRNDALVQSTDFFPTFVDLIGFKTKPEQFFDGVFFAPALRGESLLTRCHLHLLPPRPTRPRLDPALSLSSPRKLRPHPRVPPRKKGRSPLPPLRPRERHRRDQKPRFQISRNDHQTRCKTNAVLKRNKSGYPLYKPQI
ncbi:MAG: sulfatase-like hydrolase/transferase [Akkermansiaceae bacterium]